MKILPCKSMCRNSVFIIITLRIWLMLVRWAGDEGICTRLGAECCVLGKAWAECLFKIENTPPMSPDRLLFKSVDRCLMRDFLSAGMWWALVRRPFPNKEGRTMIFPPHPVWTHFIISWFPCFMVAALMVLPMLESWHFSTCVNASVFCNVDFALTPAEE